MKKLPPNVSRYQYESLVMLTYSSRFRDEAYKLYVKHEEVIAEITDFDSNKAEKSFARDLKKLMKNYKLPDNFMVPVGNFVKTLRPQDLLRDIPPFFSIVSMDSRVGGAKHVAVEFYVEPTTEEMEIVRKSVSKAFKNEDHTVRMNASKTLVRNLNIYMLHSGMLNPKKNVDEIVATIYEDVTDEPSEQLAESERKRKMTVKKALQEVKKEFRKRFGQEIE